MSAIWKHMNEYLTRWLRRKYKHLQHSPWRKHQPQTAGQIRKGLVNILRHVAIRSWWNAKYKKFMPPDWNKNWNSG
jgi:hypothetical protein